MKRSDKRVLTTHVGSIIRPQELVDKAHASSKSPAELKAYEDYLMKATADIVKRQAECRPRYRQRWRIRKVELGKLCADPHDGF